MTDVPERLSDRAAVLRRDFDRTFSEPARRDTATKSDFLSIRVGSENCAVRLSEISGVFAEKKITAVPSRVAALLGIAGFRGAIVPVYSLPALLGHRAMDIPRWLMIAAAAPIALAFDAVERHLRVSEDAILPSETGNETRRLVRGHVKFETHILPILHLPSILDIVRAQTATKDHEREP